MDFTLKLLLWALVTACPVQPFAFDTSRAPLWLFQSLWLPTYNSASSFSILLLFLMHKGSYLTFQCPLVCKPKQGPNICRQFLKSITNPSGVLSSLACRKDIHQDSLRNNISVSLYLLIFLDRLHLFSCLSSLISV